MRRSLLMVGIASLLITSVVSCRPYVWVQQKRYRPVVSAELQSVYRGRAIFLAPFESRTPSAYYYYGTSGANYEVSPRLVSYVRDCFERALRLKMGMRVTQTGRRILGRSANTMLIGVVKTPADVPGLEVTILQWSAERVVLKVLLSFNTTPLYNRTYTVQSQPPAGPQKPQLELQAFQQMNRVISTIFGDVALQRAFLRASGGTAARRGATPVPATPPPTPPPAR